MIKKPFFSIVINCYNGESFLKDALDSVYSQTCGDWEVIFWDNASTDNSSKIVNEYDSRIKYYLSPTTYPLYSARNLALRKASGKYIAFIDVDDIWEPEKLEVIKNLINVYPDELIYASNFDCFLGKKFSNSQYPTSGTSVYIRNFSSLINTYDIALSSIVINADLLKRNGGFDEKFNFTADKELILRLTTTNNICISSRVLVHIRIHDHNATNGNMDRFAIENLFLIEKMINLGFITVDNIEVLTNLVNKAIFKHAVHMFSINNSVNARNLISKTLPQPKFLLFYMITFLPSSIYLFLLKIYRILR